MADRNVPTRRYHLDRGVQRHGTTIVGGSPLGLFRLTDAGARLIDRVEAGDEIGPSTLVDRLLDTGTLHPAPTDSGRFGSDDVTVIVPSLGTPLHVPPGALVVDDGSRPPIDGATIRLEDNAGPACARNAGLAAVTTPLVAFVDADVRLPTGWLDALLPHFDDERVGLVAPRVRSRPRPDAVGRYEREHSPLDLGDEPARIRAGTRVGYVPAAAIVCRTDAIRAIGGFDETLRFGEDVDLCWRLDEAGWRCRYEPAAEVEHDPRPDWAAVVRQRIGYGSSAAPLARRHPGALAPIRMSGWSVATWVLGAVGRPVAGALVGLGSAAALVRKLPDLPPRVSFRLAAIGNLHAGDQLAAAIRRAWWPIVAVAAIRSRAARRVLLAAATAAGRPERLLDDVAYSLGVWQGAVRERSAAALVPEIRSWPGRSALRSSGRSVGRRARAAERRGEPLPSER